MPTSLCEGVCLELTSSWPPARVEGRSRVVVPDTWSAGSGGSAESAGSGIESQKVCLCCYLQYLSVLTLSKNYPVPPLAQGGPMGAKGSPRAPRRGPKGTPKDPKRVKTCPKENTKRTKHMCLAMNEVDIQYFENFEKGYLLKIARSSYSDHSRRPEIDTNICCYTTLPINCTRGWYTPPLANKK